MLRHVKTHYSPRTGERSTNNADAIASACLNEAEAIAYVHRLASRHARKLIDLASSRGKTYALPIARKERRKAIKDGRHRAPNDNGPKGWDYLMPELTAEMFSALLYRATEYSAANAIEGDTASRIRHAITQKPVWAMAKRDAQSLFSRMKHGRRVDLSEADKYREVYPDLCIDDSDTMKGDTSREEIGTVRQWQELTEALAAYYMKASPRNASTLLRSDIAAVRALAGGQLSLDGKGNAFARFARLIARANEGAELLGRARIAEPIASVRRKAGRPALHTV